jgi:hypothetical protein
MFWVLLKIFVQELTILGTCNGETVCSMWGWNCSRLLQAINHAPHYISIFTRLKTELHVTCHSKHKTVTFHTCFLWECDTFFRYTYITKCDRVVCYLSSLTLYGLRSHKVWNVQLLCNCLYSYTRMTPCWWWQSDRDISVGVIYTIKHILLVCICWFVGLLQSTKLPEFEVDLKKIEFITSKIWKKKSCCGKLNLDWRTNKIYLQYGQSGFLWYVSVGNMMSISTL